MRAYLSHRAWFGSKDCCRLEMKQGDIGLYRVAVKELNLSHYIGETMLVILYIYIYMYMYMYTEYGNLI